MESQAAALPVQDLSSTLTIQDDQADKPNDRPKSVAKHTFNPPGILCSLKSA